MLLSQKTPGRFKYYNWKSLIQTESTSRRIFLLLLHSEYYRMPSLRNQRIALSTFFFLAGFSFSSWTSRIPTIAAALHLNEAELGSILFAMPVASMIGLPFSSWLVTKYETRIPLTVGFLLNSLCLSLIAFADSATFLVVSLVLYALCTRVLNISVNTQAINLQNLYGRKINGSFHG